MAEDEDSIAAQRRAKAAGNKARLAAIMADPERAAEYRARAAAYQKMRRHTDPEFRKRQAESNRKATRKRLSSPAARARHNAQSEAIARRRMQDEAQRALVLAQRAERKRRRRADPVAGKRISHSSTASKRARRQRDALFRLSGRLRARIRMALKAKSGAKACRTMELIGCSVDHLRQHLEAQFIEGMTWKNMQVWHVDHITPCAAFDLNDPEQQKRCFHWSNLQPLLAAVNLRKGAKTLPCVTTHERVYSQG